MATQNDSEKSVLREKLCLHFFLSDVYKICWNNDEFIDIQVLFPEIDSCGADVVIVHNKVSCFIQLKSVTKTSKTKFFKINTKLFSQSSFCVLLLSYDNETSSLSYRIFKKQNDMSFKTAKHTKPNSEGIKKERTNIIELPINRFTDITANSDLLNKIFETENIPVQPNIPY